MSMLRDEEEGEMPDHFRRILLSMIALAVSLGLVATAGALTLITEDEARLPPGRPACPAGALRWAPDRLWVGHPSRWPSAACVPACRSFSMMSVSTHWPSSMPCP